MSYGKEWVDTRNRIIERDGGKCRYCGAYATSADHVIPKHISQDDSDENLVAVCKPCNKTFNGTYFGSFEEKLAYYKEHVLDVWNEYVQRVKKAESQLGKPLTEKQKRKGRMTMIAEGKFPIAPRERGFDHCCVTCATTASAQRAAETGWPNEQMCPACANDAGVAVVPRTYRRKLKMSQYEELAAKDEENLSTYQLDFRMREEREKRGMSESNKKLWNLKHADRLEANMIYRRVCRDCGAKIENFEYRDGLPYCSGGCRGKESTQLAPNVDWFRDEREKKPQWHWPTKEDRAMRDATYPETWLPDEIVKDTKSRAERHAWNKVPEHATWLELTMKSQRVCRECGDKTPYYDLIDGLPVCEECQTKRED